MTDFDLERELTNLLHDKSETMPHAVDSDPAIVKRARSRRNTKLASIGGGSAAALALVVGLFATNANNDNEVKIQPAPPGPTTETKSRVLDRGAIVGARLADNVIVELDAQGNEVRELVDLSDMGAVLEIDPHPDGNELYVRVAEATSCGLVLQIDLETGDRAALGQANGVALSGNGRYAAFSTNLVSNTMVCDDGGAKQVVVRDLATGLSMEAAVSDGDRPDIAGELALNSDGTAIAFEQCWEGCDVRIVDDISVRCVGGEVVCDRDIPKWSDLRELAGAGAGVEDPAFVAGRLLAVECDCEVESEQLGYHLAEFDVTNGERVDGLQTLADDQIGWAMTESGFVIETTSDGTTSLYKWDEYNEWSTTIGEVAVVPFEEIEPSSPTTTNTTVDSTSPPSNFAPLEPGAIVAARPDGWIVELDTEGNELRELYDAGERVAEVDVVPGGTSLLVRVGEALTCGQVSLVDLATGNVEILGTASGVAVSGDGRVVAMSAMPDDSGIADCFAYADAVMVQILEQRTSVYAIPYTPDPPQPDYAVNLALSHDGSVLTFEQCWEGCIIRLTEVPVQCLDNSVDCDLAAPPSWDEMTALQHDGRGYGAGARLPSFQGEVIVAAVCDCPDGPDNYRLVSFDAQTGEQLNVIQDLPDGVTSLSIAGSVVLVGINNNSIIRYTDEPFTFPGEYTTATMVPVIAE